MFSRSEKRILTSLVYSSLFNYPLTKEEIRLRLFRSERVGELWRWSETVNEPVSQRFNLSRVLQDLVARQVVVRDKGFYFPRQFIVGSINPFNLRLKKEQWSKALKQELPPLLEFAQNHSWLKAAVITGSTAVNSAWREDDVDLMIISRKNRLWLLRTMVLCWELFTGRKKFGSSSKQDWCFNLWLSAEELSMEPDRRSFYTALEICQTDWFYQTDQLELRFLQANDWLEDYLPNYYQDKLVQARSRNKPQIEEAKSNFFFSFFLNQLNRLLFWIESSYTHFKTGIPREHLRLGQAFFHKKASSQALLIRLKLRLKELEKD